MKKINYQGHEIINDTKMDNEKALEVFSVFCDKMSAKGHPIT